MSRRALAVALLLALAGPVLAQNVQASAGTREFRFIMGTSIAVEAFGGDERQRHTAIEEIFAAFEEIDRLMSDYRSDSELSLINREAAQHPVPMSDPVRAVIEAGLRVGRESGGAFSVTTRPLSVLYGFKSKRPYLPAEAELAALRPLMSLDNVSIDGRAGTIRFAKPGVALDLGGIAKGFAVELAGGILRRAGLSGSIDAGGNQYMTGLPPGKDAWVVGIQHPDSRTSLLGRLRIPADMSVSTSAGYSTFLETAGRRLSHILDPRTMKPTEAALSATVVSKDGTIADALSTAALVIGPSALALIESHKDTYGMIAYRKSDGSLGLVLSSDLERRLDRAAPTSIR